MIRVNVTMTNGEEYSNAIKTAVEAETFAEQQRAKSDVAEVKVIGKPK